MGRLFGIVALLGCAVIGGAVLITGGVGDGFYAACVFVIFFLYFRGFVHILKMSVAYYLPDRWFDPDRVAWRIAMLWQVPDIVIAGVAALLVAIAQV